MRAYTTLLIGSSVLALAFPAAAQTGEEQQAQAANQQEQAAPSAPAEVSAADQGEIIVTATKRASRVQTQTDAFGRPRVARRSRAKSA